MQFVKPQLFTEAIDKIGSKSPIGSKLNTEQWADVPLALRERALFSKMEARYVAIMRVWHRSPKAQQAA